MPGLAGLVNSNVTVVLSPGARQFTGIRASHAKLSPAEYWNIQPIGHRSVPLLYICQDLLNLQFIKSNNICINDDGGIPSYFVFGSTLSDSLASGFETNAIDGSFNGASISKYEQIAACKFLNQTRTIIIEYFIIIIQYLSHMFIIVHSV